MENLLDHKVIVNFSFKEIVILGEKVNFKNLVFKKSNQIKKFRKNFRIKILKNGLLNLTCCCSANASPSCGRPPGDGAGGLGPPCCCPIACIPIKGWPGCSCGGGRPPPNWRLTGSIIIWKFWRVLKITNTKGLPDWVTAKLHQNLVTFRRK